MECDPHQGHVNIISALEAVIEGITIHSNHDSYMCLCVVDTEKDFPQPVLHDKNSESCAKTAALRSRVVKANNDIRMKFTKLVLDIYRLLSKKML